VLAGAVSVKLLAAAELTLTVAVSLRLFTQSQMVIVWLPPPTVFED